MWRTARNGCPTLAAAPCGCAGAAGAVAVAAGPVIAPAAGVVLPGDLRQPTGARRWPGAARLQGVAVTLLAVDEGEAGKLAAESGLGIVLQSANHGNEVNALDSLREPRYSHVMSITGIARYTKGPTAGSIGPARRPS